MKIKRWAIYDGIAGKYYRKRYIFRASAERVRDELIYGYTLDLMVMGDELTIDEVESIKVVELR